jgi:hypothetical protein
VAVCLPRLSCAKANDRQRNIGLLSMAPMCVGSGPFFFLLFLLFDFVFARAV